MRVGGGAAVCLGDIDGVVWEGSDDVFWMWEEMDGCSCIGDRV